MSGGSQSMDVIYFDIQEHSFQAKKVLGQSTVASLGQREEKGVP